MAIFALSSRELALNHFADYRKTHQVEKGDDTVLIVEKHGVKEEVLVAPFSEGAETFEAFADTPLKDGSVTYLEYTPFNRQKEPEHRLKEGFVYNGQIINVAALAIFKTPSSTEQYVITLNETKLPAGSLEASDTLDIDRLSIVDALRKGALREFAEETLGLQKGKDLKTAELQHFICENLGTESIEVKPLVRKIDDLSIERLPNPEFNKIFCSPVVIIQLGTVKEEVSSKLKVEEGKTDTPKVMVLSDLISEASKFRNKEQLNYFVKS